ncbi:MAG: hypothetical protein SFU25_06985 [Candidatus Caenarcaniphilales bacterium]|nr:hypothetical protein [Candidatus Caenarcaniphilales bacterium]
MLLAATWALRSRELDAIYDRIRSTNSSKHEAIGWLLNEIALLVPGMPHCKHPIDVQEKLRPYAVSAEQSRLCLLWRQMDHPKTLERLRALAYPQEN